MVSPFNILHNRFAPFKGMIRTSPPPSKPDSAQLLSFVRMVHEAHVLPQSRLEGWSSSSSSARTRGINVGVAGLALAIGEEFR